MVFRWSLSDSKSPQVSRTLLSIMSILNNAVVCIVSTRPPTSKSSSPFSNSLFAESKAPITIGIIVTCMSHRFLKFWNKIEVIIIIIMYSFIHLFLFIYYSCSFITMVFLIFKSIKINLTCR